MAIAAMGGIYTAFKRRCCRNKHNRAIFDLPAHDRHVSRVVGNAVFLLVGRLMLLIDDDCGEIVKRKKQRRARANDGLSFALGDSAPKPRSLAGADARMPFARSRAK